MHHLARAVLTGVSAATAALAASSMSALAFDRVESLAPIPAGHSYVYYVKELDDRKLPLSGRMVTMSVQHGAGHDTSVAPCDAQGHATGSAGATASEVSGGDGLAFFILQTSTTPGENVFVWRDDNYSGQVTVPGRPLDVGTAGATGSAQGGGVRPHRGATAPAHARLPQTAVPPLGAGILAVLVVWLVAPPILRRRLERLELPPLAAARPAPAELG